MVLPTVSVDTSRCITCFINYSPRPCSRPGLTQIRKTEMVLGKSESTRFRRAFDRADAFGDGELTTGDAVRAYRSLGGKTTEKEVRNGSGEVRVASLA